MSKRALPITVEMHQHQYAVFAAAARARGLTPSGLLELLAETFVVTQQLPARTPGRAGATPADPLDRIGELLARLVQRDGPITVGAAWRSLSHRDRQRGRDVFDQAVERAVERGMITAGPDGLAPVTG
jgi:hypothetical protein